MKHYKTNRPLVFRHSFTVPDQLRVLPVILDSLFIDTHLEKEKQHLL